MAVTSSGLIFFFSAILLSDWRMASRPLTNDAGKGSWRMTSCPAMAAT